MVKLLNLLSGLRHKLTRLFKDPRATDAHTKSSALTDLAKFDDAMIESVCRNFKHIGRGVKISTHDEARINDFFSDAYLRTFKKAVKTVSEVPNPEYGIGPEEQARKKGAALLESVIASTEMTMHEAKRRFLSNIASAYEHVLFNRAWLQEHAGGDSKPEKQIITLPTHFATPDAMLQTYESLNIQVLQFWQEGMNTKIIGNNPIFQHLNACIHLLLIAYASLNSTYAFHAMEFADEIQFEYSFKTAAGKDLSLYISSAEQMDDEDFVRDAFDIIGRYASLCSGGLKIKLADSHAVITINLAKEKFFADVKISTIKL
ncbi:hypothetical protein [Chitinophaga rhizophila]|uniref:Uncharacterized protein n=1 Tax=Chitinophaga rhizophila TaxID=2866212 RepID=A0ABS7G748_9BACT|nr:hypothetical protein [Chitinophaga rhizophila]MBW8683482.1 hypothetical protein [Chitinophaga rhizophila]